MRSLSSSPKINKEDALVEKGPTVGHFSLNSRAVTKRSTTDIQNNDEDENVIYYMHMIFYIIYFLFI